MPYHSWASKPPSKEYDEKHAATFGPQPDPFCPGCGRLPHFCECGLKAWLPDLSTPKKQAEHARAMGPLTSEP